MEWLNVCVQNNADNLGLNTFRTVEMERTCSEVKNGYCKQWISACVCVCRVCIKGFLVNNLSFVSVSAPDLLTDAMKTTECEQVSHLVCVCK